MELQRLKGRDCCTLKVHIVCDIYICMYVFFDVCLCVRVIVFRLVELYCACVRASSDCSAKHLLKVPPSRHDFKANQELTTSRKGLQMRTSCR